MTGAASIVMLPGAHEKCGECREEASTFARCACGKVIARCGLHGIAASKKCHARPL